jgi:peptidoglycan-associated lipoprotein
MTSVLAMDARPADACGVKLTVKGSAAHRKGVSRTSNPSDVLLLGSPPRRLQRDLSAAGHRVEVAPNAAAAKRKSYKVVITDQQQSEEARAKFSGAVVMVRSGDVVADMRSVEKQVARQPVAVDQGRGTVVAARENRAPIAAGPVQPRREIVTAAPPKEPTPAETRPATAPATRPTAAVTPPSRPVAAATPPPSRPTPPPTAAVETKPEPATPEVVSKPAEPKPVVAKTVTRAQREVYFALGAAMAETSVLGDVVKWMNGSPDVSIIVEGHADPTGSAEANMALSQKRAEFVRDFLVSAGIDASRIEVSPFGSSRLKYSASDRRNRRAAVVPK